MKQWMVIFALLLLLLPSCGDRVACDLLDRAQSLIERDSCESALALLDSIDRESLPGGETQALHALLLTQARNKCYIDEVNDSLITTAVDYFSSSGERGNYVKSMFYKAQILHYAKDYRQSIIWAMKANDLSKRLGDDYWTAKSSELLGTINNTTFNGDSEVKCFAEAALYYDRAGKRLNHLFSLCDLAVAYGNNGDAAKSIALLDSIERVASSSPADSAIIGYCVSSSIPAYLQLERYSDALKSVWRLRGLGNVHSLSLNDCAHIASLYQAVEEEDSMLLYMDMALKSSATANDSAIVNAALTNHYKSKGDYRKALAVTDELLDYQNRTFGDLLKNSVVTAQRDFYDSQSREAECEAAKMSRIVIAGLILGVVIIAAGILFHRLRMRVKNAEIENRMAQILILSEKIKRQDEDRLTLSSSLEEMDGSNLALRNLVDELFRERWETINRMCDEYFEKGGTKSTRYSIVNDVEAEIKRACSSANLVKIESMVNSCRGSMVARLREQCHFLAEEDVKFLVLLYAGFSPRAICLFTGMKLKYYYNKRARLFERIMKSTAVDKALFTGKRD